MKSFNKLGYCKEILQQLMAEFAEGEVLFALGNESRKFIADLDKIRIGKF